MIETKSGSHELEFDARCAKQIPFGNDRKKSKDSRQNDQTRFREFHPSQSTRRMGHPHFSLVRPGPFGHHFLSLWRDDNEAVDIADEDSSEQTGWQQPVLVRI